MRDSQPGEAAANAAADRMFRVVGLFLLVMVALMLTAGGYAYGGWRNSAGCFLLMAGMWLLMATAPWRLR